MRIAVVGASGSGKTSFSQELSRILGLPHTELDSLYWRPNWKSAPEPEFLSELGKAVSPAHWILDGDYDLGRELIWAKADLVIWLDPPLPSVLWQSVFRAARRLARRETLWNGNQESLRSLFLGPEPLALWVSRSYFARRKAYPALLRERGGNFVRLRSRGQCAEYLLRLSSKPGA